MGQPEDDRGSSDPLGRVIPNNITFTSPASSSCTSTSNSKIGSPMSEGTSSSSSFDEGPARAETLMDQSPGNVNVQGSKPNPENPLPTENDSNFFSETTVHHRPRLTRASQLESVESKEAEIDKDTLPGPQDSTDKKVNRNEGPEQQRKRAGGFSFGFSGLNKVFSSTRKWTQQLPQALRNRSSDDDEAEEDSVHSDLCASPPHDPRMTLTHRLSKSSSESNIPTCLENTFNSSVDLDNLPSSCSTDSDGILPILVTSVNNSSGFLDSEQRQGPSPPVRRNSCDDGTLEPSTILNVVRSRSPVNNGLSPEVKGLSEIPGPSGCRGGASNSSGTCASCQFLGPKFKLLTEGDVQLCKVKHGQNLMSKLASSKLLRRWESHHIYLNDLCISSKTPIGSLTTPISYWQMEEVYVVIRWDSGKRYIIRIVLPDGSLLLQAPNVYARDQWYHSIIWKKNIFKYQNLMRSSKRPEVIMKELKSLVDFATTTPLQDDCISHIPVQIVSNLLDSAGDLLGKSQSEEVLVALAPLLDRSHPPSALCRFFSRHCQTRPRCPLVAQIFTPVVRRALKHNVDFGKCPHMRRFIQDYFLALNTHNDGINVVRNFVKSIHGPGSSCPHPKVMSNLVSVSLAAIFAIFEKNNAKRASNFRRETLNQVPWDEELLCYLAIFDAISEFDDWRPHLAVLLQPIPFPDDALSNPLFTRSMSSVLRRIGTDVRCDVHQMLLGVREGKEGWFELYSPSNLAYLDDFDLWGLMLERLLSCCCRRKRFLSELGGKLLGSCLLLALREHRAAQDALCLLLEWELVTNEDQRLQIASTLQSTPSGTANYIALSGRLLHLKELQQKGGPRKLTLPSRSTDADLAKLLSCGSLGNLECLSLAFTQVTSACAEELIKLRSLRYLNLWSTQFGDSGLELISEHLPNLQVLNLCETPVSDKGLLSLTCLRSLRKLNLNSTSLSASTYQRIRHEIPGLREVDVRYTDAW